LSEAKNQNGMTPQVNQVLLMQKTQTLPAHAVIYALPAGFVHPQSPHGLNPALMRGDFLYPTLNFESS
jgi:hypothetical protein